MKVIWCRTVCGKHGEVLNPGPFWVKQLLAMLIAIDHHLAQQNFWYGAPSVEYVSKLYLLEIRCKSELPDTLRRSLDFLAALLNLKVHRPIVFQSHRIMTSIEHLLL